MVLKHNIILFCATVLIRLHSAICAEYIPTYIWGNNKISENIPALQKYNEDSFRDTLLEHTKLKPYIVVFAEYALSSEDFVLCQENKKAAFHNLQHFRETLPSTYIPYVENPIEAIKQLGTGVTEVSIESLVNNLNVPKDNILIIDLNDAKDDEERCTMMKRHDADIATIYKALADIHKNILAVYTGYHPSWVSPEKATEKRTRDLLQAKEDEPETEKFMTTTDAIMYISNNINYVNTVSNENFSTNAFTATSTSTTSTVVLTLDATNLKITFTMDVSNETRYWTLSNVAVNSLSIPVDNSVVAPTVYSYHCSDFRLANENLTLTIPGFQLQPIDNGSKFGDAYDCVGFTSIPIWAGLFVTLILLMILTFGISMMMDIKTMDRFDDSKGKTITINAAE